MCFSTGVASFLVLAGGTPTLFFTERHLRQYFLATDYGRPVRFQQPDKQKQTYRRWAVKTLYLKTVKCSGEPKDKAALTLS